MSRRERLATLMWVLAALVLLGCGDSQNPPSSDDSQTREEVEQKMPENAASPDASASSGKAGTVPAVQESAAAKTADSAGAHDPETGAGLYAQYCATCHGARGGGDGPISQGLDPKPAKHHDGHYMNALSNDHLFKVIKEGGPSVGKSPLMAPWGGVMNDEQIWDVVAFVRSLADPPYTGPKP